MPNPNRIYFEIDRNTSRKMQPEGGKWFSAPVTNYPDDQIWAAGDSIACGLAGKENGKLKLKVFTVRGSTGWVSVGNGPVSQYGSLPYGVYLIRLVFHL